MVRDEQVEWLSAVATMAPAALLKAKTAQLAVSAVGVAVQVRWPTWVLAVESTCRRQALSTSVVAAISMFDPIETSPA